MEHIIRGNLFAAKIFPREDGIVEVQIGLLAGGEFIEDTGTSFNAHWLTDLLCVLNRTKNLLSDEIKYQKITSTTIEGKLITEYAEVV